MVLCVDIVGVGIGLGVDFVLGSVVVVANVDIGVVSSGCCHCICYGRGSSLTAVPFALMLVLAHVMLFCSSCEVVGGGRIVERWADDKKGMEYTCIACSCRMLVHRLRQCRTLTGWRRSSRTSSPTLPRRS